MSDQEQEPGTNGAHPKFIVEDIPIDNIQLPDEVSLSPDRTMMAEHLYQLFPPDFVHAYPDARVEVAVAHPVTGAINKAETFSPFDIEKICDFAESKNITKHNVYIGPSLRKGSCPQHARSSDNHVLTSAVCWAEYDCQGDDERVQAALTQIGLQVVLANTTGTVPCPRRHLFFKLEGHPTADEIRAANNALMRRLATDDVRNPARLMKLGGTISYPTKDKPKKGYVPELVAVHSVPNAKSYKIDELIRLTATATNIKSKALPSSRTTETNGRTTDEIVALLELTKVDGQWHNSMRNAIASMVGRGWGRDQVEIACAPYSKGGATDPDLVPLIDGAFNKGWGKASAKPNPYGAHYDWDDPDWTLLDERRGSLPDFPLDTFTPPLRELTIRSAHGAGVGIEHVAVPMIVVASGLIGCARRIRASRGWSQPCTLWGAIVADSGDGKTPGLRVSTRVLDFIEKANAPDIKEKRLSHETRVQKAREILKKWKDDREAATDEGLEPPPMPVDAIDPGNFVEPRLYCNDPTIERMTVLIKARPRGMILIRDELSGHFANMNRYSGGSDRHYWLQAYDGGSYKVERQSHSIGVEQLLIGIVGGFQPDKISKAFDGDEDGMSGRFLFAWLKTPEYRPLSNDVDEFDAGFINAMTHLVRLPCEDADGENFVPVEVWLSEEAILIFEEYRKWCDGMKRGLTGREKQWIVKSPANVLRLTATLAFMAWSMTKSDPNSTGFQDIIGHLEPKTIGREFMEAAIRQMKEFFSPHAKAVLRQIGLNDRHKNGRSVLKWIRQHGLAEVSVKDIRRDFLGQRLDADSTEKLLDDLERGGWLRKATIRTPGRSRHRWQVNPKLFEEEVAASAVTAERWP